MTGASGIYVVVYADQAMYVDGLWSAEKDPERLVRDLSSARRPGVAFEVRHVTADMTHEDLTTTFCSAVAHAISDLRGDRRSSQSPP